MAMTYQRLAHAYVKIAVRLGHLPALDGFIPCADCGKPAAHYDHRDYARPLDVVPVCVRCNIWRGPAKNHHERPLKKSQGHISRARVFIGMTQRELAQALGVQQSYLSKIETQSAPISRKLAPKLAAILGLPILAVLCGPDSEHAKVV